MCRDIKSSRQEQSGLTLVELLISAVIASVMAAAMLQGLAASTHSEFVRDQLAGMQEASRYAFHVIADEVRMAGYMGCMDATSNGLRLVKTPEQSNADINRYLIRENNNINPLIFERTALFDVLIEGVEGNASGPISLENWAEKTPILIGPKMASASDALIVQRADYEGAVVTATELGQVHTENATIRASDVALVTDCLTTDMFYVAGTENKSLQFNDTDNTSSSLQHFSKTGNLTSYRFQGKVFFIGYVNDDPQGTPALFALDLLDPQGGKEIVAEGIENMQVQYGLHADNGLLYVSAHELHAQANPYVSTVKITLMIRTLREVANKDTLKSHDLNGTTIQTNDRYARSILSETIKIRNRRLI